MSTNTESLINQIENIAVDKIINILEGTLKLDKLPMSDYIKAYSLVNKILSSNNKKDVISLNNFINEKLSAFVNNICNKLKALSNESYVYLLSEEITKCKVLVYWFSKVFSSIEKHKNISLKNITIIQQALITIKNNLIDQNCKEIFTNLDNLFIKDRDNKEVDRNKLKNIVNFFFEVDIYNPILNSNFDITFIVNHTDNDNTDIMSSKYNKNNFYSSRNVLKKWLDFHLNSMQIYCSKRSSKDIKLYTVTEYINIYIKYFDEEDIRKVLLYPNYIYSNIDDINQLNFIDSNLIYIEESNTGIKHYLDEDKKNELKNLYKFYTKINNTAISSISKVLNKYIIEKGEALLLKSEISKNPVLFVPELLKLLKYFKKLIEICFDNNKHFKSKLFFSFFSFMNKDIYPIHIANYTDFFMKVHVKKINNAKQIDDEIEDIADLIKVLPNKSTFLRRYSKLLSDRLIASKSANLIAEKTLVSKIRIELGASATCNLTTMFQDLDTSIKTVDLFRKLEHRAVINGINFSCQVLQQASWQIDKNKFVNLNLTDSMNKCLKEWTTFYKTIYSNHCLNWVHGYSTLTIQTTYLKKTLNITINPIQYIILYLLELKESLIVSDIKGLLSINMYIVLACLNGLLFNPSFNTKKDKHLGIINCNFSNNEPPEIKEHHTISINKNFNPQNLKINLLPFAFKMSTNEANAEKEREEIAAKTEENYIIDSYLVRIMKSRIGKETNHSQLVSEVAKQITLFVAQPNKIKDRIESLINKNIIKRDPDNYNIYQYIS